MVGVNKISVLIPSLPKDSLTELLRSLQGQPYDELIIDIQGGTVAEKRQRLFDKSTGDIIVYLDDDVYVSKGFISNGVQAFINSDADYGQFKVVGGIENSFDVFVGAATIFYRTVLNQVSWSEDIPFFNEDLDLHWNLQDAGFAYCYIHEVTAYHPNMGNYEKLIEGNKLLQKKHPARYIKLKKELR